MAKPIITLSETIQVLRPPSATAGRDYRWNLCAIFSFVSMTELGSKLIIENNPSKPISSKDKDIISRTMAA